jgi:hypothetical protein
MDKKEWSEIAMWAGRLNMNKEQIRDLRAHYCNMCLRDKIFINAEEDYQRWLDPSQDDWEDCIIKIRWETARKQGEELRTIK